MAKKTLIFLLLFVSLFLFNSKPLDNKTTGVRQQEINNMLGKLKENKIKHDQKQQEKNVGSN